MASKYHPTPHQTLMAAPKSLSWSADAERQSEGLDVSLLSSAILDSKGKFTFVSALKGTPPAVQQYSHRMFAIVKQAWQADVEEGKAVVVRINEVHVESKVALGSNPVTGSDLLRLDLSTLPTFCVHVGMVAGFVGTVLRGEYAQLSSLKVAAVLAAPFPAPLGRLPSPTPLGTRRIIFVSGPFPRREAADILLSVVNFALARKATALCVTGPFVEEHAKEEELMADQQTYDNHMTNILNALEAAVKKRPLAVAVVPSHHDAVGDVVVPQAAFDLAADTPELVALPNPAIVRVGALSVGLCSVDVLRDVGKGMLERGGPNGRVPHLWDTIVRSRSFCPQFTCDGDVPMNLHRFNDIEFPLEGVPQFLVAPSVLPPSAHVVGPTVVINPGRRPPQLATTKVPYHVAELVYDEAAVVANGMKAADGCSVETFQINVEPQDK